MPFDKYSLTTSYDVNTTQVITSPGSEALDNDIVERRKKSIDFDLDVLSEEIFTPAELEILRNVIPELPNSKKITTNAHHKNHIQFDAQWNFAQEGKVSLLHASVEDGVYAFIDLRVERQFDAGKILFHVSRAVNGDRIIQLFLMPNNWKQNNSSLVFNLKGQNLATIGITGLNKERTIREVKAAFGAIDFDRLETSETYKEEQYQQFRNDLFKLE